MTIKSELLSSTATLSASLISSAGGEGKTAIAVAIEAALDLLGAPPQMIDVDPGSSSLTVQRATSAVKSLDANDDGKDVDKKVASLIGASVVFDVGANVFAVGASVTRTHWRMNELLRSAGYRTYVLVPVSTNKPGAMETGKQLVDAFGKYQTSLVLVNRNGSDNYDGKPDGYPAIGMPHFNSALQEFRDQLHNMGMSIADALRAPPDGWSIAADYLANWLEDFACQPFMLEMLGADIRPVLASLGRRRQPRLALRPSIAKNLHDDNFRSFLTRSEVFSKINKYGWNAAGLRAAANEIEASSLSADVTPAFHPAPTRD